MAKDKLFTRSYICILAANFLLFFGFWLLVPVLPFYLKETYGCEEMIIGAVLSCYTVSCLCVRPFSGFLMDRFPRKPIYILCYFVCVMMFPAYTAAAAISWFIALRALHGVAFGGVTVGGNTLCVDIMPSSRRGEGLGYYGLTNNIAMALGPMTGLFMHDHFTYIQIFISGMLVSVAGFVCAVAVKARMPESLRARRQMEAAGDTPAPQVTRKLSLDRFILLKGIPVSVSLFLHTELQPTSSQCTPARFISPLLPDCSSRSWRSEWERRASWQARRWTVDTSHSAYTWAIILS